MIGTDHFLWRNTEQLENKNGHIPEFLMRKIGDESLPIVIDREFIDRGPSPPEESLEPWDGRRAVILRTGEVIERKKK